MTATSEAISVEIRVPGSATVLEGKLLSASKESIKVLIPEEQITRHLRAGRTCMAIVHAKEAIYEVTAQVDSGEDNWLSLRLVSPPRRFDRRKQKRYPIRLQVAIYEQEPTTSEEGATPARQATAFDINRSGMGLWVSQPYAVGAQFWVRFSLLNVEQPITAKVEVRYCKPAGDNRWRIGVRFVEIARIDAHWLTRLFP